MNKYMGFYELKSSSLPSVPWQVFTRETVLDPGLLWTVRMAVESSNDINLPRAVGVSSEEALEKAKTFSEEYNGKGFVIYYPYFIALKSGVLDISSDRTVLEAVEKDLWNLVTYGKKNVTVIVPKDLQGIQYFGQESFLEEKEFEELMKYSNIIRGRFRDEISEGKSALVEWSFAYNTDIRNEPIGSRYLVFYELRVI